MYRGNEKITQIIYNDANSGSTFLEWKKGIELAKGEYIWIAESDDYSHPQFLETVLKNFSEKRCSVVYCQSDRVDENNIVTDWATKGYPEYLKSILNPRVYKLLKKLQMVKSKWIQ